MNYRERPTIRAWQAISWGLVCISVAQLVLRGLLNGSQAGLAIGVVCLIAAGCGFWEAHSQKQNAVQQNEKWPALRAVPDHRPTAAKG